MLLSTMILIMPHFQKTNQMSDESPHLGNKMVTATPSTETKMVSVARVCKKEDGRRQYDKKLACYFCGKIIRHRIHNHLDACHG